MNEQQAADIGRAFGAVAFWQDVAEYGEPQAAGRVDLVTMEERPAYAALMDRHFPGNGRTPAYDAFQAAMRAAYEAERGRPAPLTPAEQAAEGLRAAHAQRQQDIDDGRGFLHD